MAFRLYFEMVFSFYSVLLLSFVVSSFTKLNFFLECHSEAYPRFDQFWKVGTYAISSLTILSYTHYTASIAATEQVPIVPVIHILISSS